MTVHGLQLRWVGVQKRSETFTQAGLLLLRAAPAVSVPFRVNDVSRFFFNGVGGLGSKVGTLSFMPAACLCFTSCFAAIGTASMCEPQKPKP